MTPLSRSDLHSEVFRVMNLYFKKETSRYIANQGVCRILLRFYSHCNLFRIGNSETRSFPIDWRLIGAGVFCSPFQYGESERLRCSGSGKLRSSKRKTWGFEAFKVTLSVDPDSGKDSFQRRALDTPMVYSRSIALGIGNQQQSTT